MPRHKLTSPQQTPALEIHLDIPQIAALWGMDQKTVREEFRNEPGVIRRKGDSRETIRVPLSVVDRVQARLGALG